MLPRTSPQAMQGWRLPETVPETAPEAARRGPASARRLARGLRVLVPAPLRDPVQRPALLGWLGVGLLLRLGLMPFGVSADLLAVYWRSSLIAYEGELFGEYLVNMGAHYVHAASLRLLDPLLPPPEAVWTRPWFFDDFIALAPQVVDDFTTAPHAAQTLFALKLPYLAADLVTGLLLLSLAAAAGAGVAGARRAWVFWMLSPIGLYASYAFGRYEMLPVVLVAAALWCAERRRPWWSAVLLGLAVTMRAYPLLLVPLFALLAWPATGKPWRDAARQGAWAAVAVAPFALVMVSNRVLAGTVGEVARLQDLDTGSTLLAYTLPVAGPGAVYLFVLFALLAYGALAGRAWGWWGRRPAGPGELWLWLLAFHAGMFALVTFSAHYLAWLTPFVALALARRPGWRAVLPLHLLQVAVVLAFADVLGGPDTLLGTLRTAYPTDVALPSLRAWLLASPGLAEQALGALRTAFVALTVLLAWPVARELAWSAATGPGAGHPRTAPPAS